MAEPQFELPHRGVYFPNWAQFRKGDGKFTAYDVDPSLCTYLIVAFAKIENNQLQYSESNDPETFKVLRSLKKKNPKLKILLAIGGWTLSSQVAAVAASPSALTAFIGSALVKLREWGLDGLDIDWEFPKTENKEQFSALLQAFRSAFESEKRISGQERLILTVAVHLYMLGGYDGKVINRSCDITNVMTYDLHGAWDTKIGHHAPLYKGPFGEESAKNVADVLKAWEEAGVDKNKIVVGIPFFGRGWTVWQPQECRFGGHGDGPISASQCSGETGNWPYSEIVAHLRKSGDKPVYDDVIKSAYLAGNTFWIGYDDIVSVEGKAAWVKEHQYGGIFAWEISQDDFRGLGGNGTFPLLRAIGDVLKGRRSSATPRDQAASTGGASLATSRKFHIVKPGDTAYNIAIQYGMTLDQLRNLNMTNSMELIHPGDKIAVGPLQAGSSSRTGGDGSSTSNMSGSGETKFYIIKSGDTAYDVAVKNGLTLDQLKKLNPGKGTMEMIFPGDKIVLGDPEMGFQSVPAETSASVYPVSNVHVVKNGDTAYNIAVKNGISLDQLKKLNPDKGNMEMIFPGDKILLGHSESAKTGKSSQAPFEAAGTPSPASGVHTVQRGDTAYNIAVKNSISLDQLKKLNPDKGSMEMIFPGDRIVVAQIGTSATPNPSSKPVNEPTGAQLQSSAIHTVQSGDTAYNIAVKNGMSLDQLKKLNPDKGSLEMIFPGDRIVIRQPAAAGSSAAEPNVEEPAATRLTTSRIYIVQSGDTAYNIAVNNGLSFEQLKKFNPGKGTLEMIHPGDKIVIGP